MTNPNVDRTHRELVDLLLDHLHQTTSERDTARQQLADIIRRAAEAVTASTTVIQQLQADLAATHHTISDLKTERDQLRTQLADAHHHLSPR